MSRLILLTAATATNDPPSAETDGVPIWKRTWHYDVGLWRGTDRATVLVNGTVTASGTGSVTIKLWAMDRDGNWYPLGTNSDSALKGVLNEGNALAETGTDTIHHSEIVTGFAAFRRMYAEITAISSMDGVDVYLDAPAGAVRDAG